MREKRKVICIEEIMRLLRNQDITNNELLKRIQNLEKRVSLLQNLIEETRLTSQPIQGDIKLLKASSTGYPEIY